MFVTVGSGDSACMFVDFRCRSETVDVLLKVVAVAQITYKFLLTFYSK